MPLLADKLELSKFNITESPKLYSKPEFGGLYIPPDEDFSEIPQDTLNEFVEINQLKPLKGYNKQHLEFFPDEIFFEKSFEDLDTASQFVRNFFAHFKEGVSDPSEAIIDKLRRFISVTSPDDKIRCRFEVVSGDSCKKFHVDNIDSRLIFTCAGLGTQIKHPDKDKFISVPPGAALILKGLKYPKFKLTTLHRSPPISQEKTKRFLFIADYS